MKCPICQQTNSGTSILPEEWRPIPGELLSTKKIIIEDDLYECSNHGRIRRTDGKKVQIINSNTSKNKTHTFRGDIILEGIDRVTKKKKGTLKTVSRTILFVFQGSSIDRTKKLCLHQDDNGRNNHLENLRWGNHSENLKDSYNNKKRGVTPRIVQSIKSIQMIRHLKIEQACFTRDIANWFECGNGVIQSIFSGKNYISEKYRPQPSTVEMEQIIKEIQYETQFNKTPLKKIMKYYQYPLSLIRAIGRNEIEFVTPNL